MAISVSWTNLVGTTNNPGSLTTSKGDQLIQQDDPSSIPTNLLNDVGDNLSIISTQAEKLFPTWTADDGDHQFSSLHPNDIPTNFNKLPYEIDPKDFLTWHSGFQIEYIKKYSDTAWGTYITNLQTQLATQQSELATLQSELGVLNANQAIDQDLLALLKIKHPANFIAANSAASVQSTALQNNKFALSSLFTALYGSFYATIPQAQTYDIAGAYFNNYADLFPSQDLTDRLNAANADVTAKVGQYNSLAQTLGFHQPPTAAELNLASNGETQLKMLLQDYGNPGSAFPGPDYDKAFSEYKTLLPEVWTEAIGPDYSPTTLDVSPTLQNLKDKLQELQNATPPDAYKINQFQTLINLKNFYDLVRYQKYSALLDLKKFYDVSVNAPGAKEYFAALYEARPETFTGLPTASQLQTAKDYSTLIQTASFLSSLGYSNPPTSANYLDASQKNQQFKALANSFDASDLNLPFDKTASFDTQSAQIAARRDAYAQILSQSGYPDLVNSPPQPSDPIAYPIYQQYLQYQTFVDLVPYAKFQFGRDSSNFLQNQVGRDAADIYQIDNQIERLGTAWGYGGAPIPFTADIQRLEDALTAPTGVDVQAITDKQDEIDAKNNQIAITQQAIADAQAAQANATPQSIPVVIGPYTNGLYDPTKQITVVFSTVNRDKFYVVEQLQKKDFSTMPLADQKVIAQTEAFQGRGDPNPLVGLASKLGLLPTFGMTVDQAQQDQITKIDGAITIMEQQGTAAHMPAEDVKVFTDELENIKKRLNNMGVFDPTQIAASTGEIQERFKRAQAFAQSVFAPQPTIDTTGIDSSLLVTETDANGKTQYKYIGVVSSDGNATIARGYKVFMEQEKRILSLDNTKLSLSLTGTVGTGPFANKKLDLPQLIFYFQMYDNLKLEAITTAATEEIQQQNAYLKDYALMQQILNDGLGKMSSLISKNQLGEGDGIAINGLKGDRKFFDDITDPQKRAVIAMFDETLRAGVQHPMEYLGVGISAPLKKLIDLDTVNLTGHTKQEWTTWGTQLSDAVNVVNQQTQLKMNDINSFDKEKNRHFELANTALTKLLEILQKILAAD